MSSSTFETYADESQLYTTFTYNDESELVIFYPRHRPPPKFSSVNIGSEVVPTDSARNTAVIFDKTMTMLPHINSVCKGAFYHLRNIARIRNS